LIVGGVVGYNPKETAEIIIIVFKNPLEVDLTVIGSLRRTFVSCHDTTALT